MNFLDYETLRVIWWVLLGVLLIGFAVMDGFDLGVGILLPFVARTDGERRVVVNAVGPVWEGNQVWLILGGGAIFAAWPLIYAVAFSGFYLAMLVVLLALILRPVGFKFRSKMPGTRWRATWDWLLFLGGFVPALIFGVAVGNALVGAPFTFDDTLANDLCRRPARPSDSFPAAGWPRFRRHADDAWRRLSCPQDRGTRGRPRAPHRLHCRHHPHPPVRYRRILVGRAGRLPDRRRLSP